MLTAPPPGTEREAEVYGQPAGCPTLQDLAGNLASKLVLSAMGRPRRTAAPAQAQAAKVQEVTKVDSLNLVRSLLRVVSKVAEHDHR